MHARKVLVHLLLVAPAAAALIVPAVGAAAGSGGSTTTEIQTVPVEATPTPESPPPTTSAPTTTQEPRPPSAPPQVQTGSSQGSAPGHGPHVRHASKRGAAANPQANAPAAKAGGKPAPSPSTLTPPLPLALGGPISGIPGFFVESFRVPPFLLPIFQAAGAAYDVPWQVLAAINEVETDYGRDLSVSSAGAEGWMQFLPAEWAIYGVDANGDGFKDPYNPADAIFAAARYLRAAGAGTNVAAAVYAYNHSQGYVESVVLRAKLLGGTPSELLGAITGLTESRFPVHAPSHFSDGFPTVRRGARNVAIPATTIFSQEGAPVIAVQDGKVVQIGSSPTLGRFVALRDAYGNTYYYAQLGSVAHLYPVLVPRWLARVSPSPTTRPSAEPRPTGPASAGSQPAQPATSSSPESAGLPALSLGLGSPLEPSGAPAGAAAPSAAAPASGASGASSAPASSPAPASAPPHSFRAGVYEVYLHTLRPGVSVVAGTVLGHVGTRPARAGETASADAAGGGSSPHIIFEIRPAGAGAPLIDPKPILDGWVALENTSIFRAKGKRAFAHLTPTPGQVLLESKEQLRRQVLANRDIKIYACGRADIEAGAVDRRVLAALEFLAVSGLRPQVSALRCAAPRARRGGDAAEHASGDAATISAVNGLAIAGEHAPGSVAERTLVKLRMLEGQMKPRLAEHAGSIEVSFAPPGASLARAAGAFGTAVSPSEWIRLIARLGEIPNPTVSNHPSPAAIPVHSSGSEGGSSGNH